MDVKEVLIEARRLIAEKGWTQRECARDKHGHVTNSANEDAVCWCGFGAISAVILPKGGDFTTWDGARTALTHACGEDWFPDFNDTPGRTREEVLAVFDRAIGELK